MGFLEKEEGGFRKKKKTQQDQKAIWDRVLCRGNAVSGKFWGCAVPPTWVESSFFGSWHVTLGKCPQHSCL